MVKILKVVRREEDDWIIPDERCTKCFSLVLKGSFAYPKGTSYVTKEHFA